MSVVLIMSDTIVVLLWSGESLLVTWFTLSLTLEEYTIVILVSSSLVPRLSRAKAVLSLGIRLGQKYVDQMTVFTYSRLTI